jgi:hypothetical protein
MSALALSNVRTQWRENRRLRMAVLVALVVLILRLMDGLDLRREALMQSQLSDMKLRQRLEAVIGQPKWRDRAEQASGELEVLRREMRVVSSAGQAQAEIQTWLSEFAKAQALGVPAVKVQEVLEVPNHPELMQVLARLDGTLPAFGQRPLVRALAVGLPWMQVERLEIGDQSPAKVSLVMRAYYRRDPQKSQPANALGAGGVP